MRCRHCRSDVTLPFIDLASAPPSNAYITQRQMGEREKWFPLKVLVCETCWLVQTEDYAGAEELFDADYAYFSSYSTTWLEHAAAYVGNMVERFDLTERSFVVEVAANDGYLLQYVMARGIPCLGIEPTASTAAAARAKGLPVIERFFGAQLGTELAAEGRPADLVVANNVLAHVPDINDFVAGFPALLKRDGVATFEFPHLLALVADNQFDTIYHEHYSYLSLTAVSRIFARNKLTIFDVEELSTHGGSLRVFAQRSDSNARPICDRVNMLCEQEVAAGVQTRAYYSGFQAKAEKVRQDLLSFLQDARAAGKKVGAYGAAAKGNTLLNFAGVRFPDIRYVVDRNVAKQGKFLPGSRIPIVAEDVLRNDRPEYILVLPWNLKSEIQRQLAYVNEWHGQLVTAIPCIIVASVPDK